LRPLPPEPFIYGEWKVAKVSIDYHVELDHHFYSVHHHYRGEQVEVRATSRTVEIFLRGERLAAHARSRARGRHTTCPEHMPKSHREHAEWSPSRLIGWAGTIGPQTAALVEAILDDRPHPEQGYRSCLGLLRLARRYGPDRLEAACARAFGAGARSYRHVDSILKHGLDRTATPSEAQASLPFATHENIRGRDYYGAAEEIPTC
jgi:transposase